ncbi:Hypothetical predicted protein [Scomber scombrus]|uniref:Uncharacterized protein n=1 Tax=Scomber scombrus TaxID=13677 RepID=A0AAV1Q5L3_SCOSC
MYLVKVRHSAATHKTNVSLNWKSALFAAQRQLKRDASRAARNMLRPAETTGRFSPSGHLEHRPTAGPHPERQASFLLLPVPQGPCS